MFPTFRERTANSSHVVAGGVVHSAHQRLPPPAPAILLGNGLAGRGAQGRAVRASQVEQHVQQNGVMVEPAGQIVADVRIVRIAAGGEFGQRQMLAYQQRDPADDVAVESHAFHDNGRVPRAFRRMVGHSRPLADVVQYAGEQQRLVMPVVVPSAAGRLAA